jgi:TATA-binding protein-associated factor
MAVKPELLRQILLPPNNGIDSPAFQAIIDGLKDSNDDIRAVASSSLLPITDSLLDILPSNIIFKKIVIVLWDSLKDLDDLTAATSYVMDLLADLIKRPTVSNVMRTEAKDFFQKLVPQLYPFIRHAIYSVRKAVIRTLKTLAELSTETNGVIQVNWITIDLIRLIFQNFVVEERQELIDDSLDLLQMLFELLEFNNFEILFGDNSVKLLFALVMSPVGTAIDLRLFVHFTSVQASIKTSSDFTGFNVSPHDRAMIDQDLTIIKLDVVIYGRIAALKSLGRLISKFTPQLFETIRDVVKAYINSAFAIHRVFIGVLIEEYAICKKEKDFVSDMIAHLDNSSMNVLFMEVCKPLKFVHDECCLLRNLCDCAGCPLPFIPAMPGDGGASVNGADNVWGTVFTVEIAEALVASVSDLIDKLHQKDENDEVNEMKVNSQARLMTLIANYKGLKLKWDTQVNMSFSAAVVAFEDLPAKQNPITRSLMASIKTEENEQLQNRAAQGLSRLINLNRHTPKGIQVNEKIVKNVCVFLCSDPVSGDISKPITDGILTITYLKQSSEIKKKSKKSHSESTKKKNQKQIEELDMISGTVDDNLINVEEDEAHKKALLILHRGFY